MESKFDDTKQPDPHKLIRFGFYLSLIPLGLLLITFVDGLQGVKIIDEIDEFSPIIGAVLYIYLSLLFLHQ